MCKCRLYSKPYFTQNKYLKLKRNCTILWLAVLLVMFNKKDEEILGCVLTVPLPKTN